MSPRKPLKPLAEFKVQPEKIAPLASYKDSFAKDFWKLVMDPRRQDLGFSDCMRGAAAIRHLEETGQLGKDDAAGYDTDELIKWLDEQ